MSSALDLNVMLLVCGLNQKMMFLYVVFSLIKPKKVSKTAFEKRAFLCT